MAEIEIAMPGKAVIGRKIIAEILDRHCLSPDEFFGRDRSYELRAARRDAAARLRAAGFSDRRIGEMLKRHQTTIVHYFNEGILERKRSASRINKAFYSLDPGIRQTITEIARAEGTSVTAVLREWINERARYEAEARARTA